MSVQIEKWGHHYWVCFYVGSNRVDEAGPFTEAYEAEEAMERSVE
jgi:hypothetical protein